jgi:hypothetical protein
MGTEAYVPGFGQDLFLSYAREDGGWVSEFQSKLIEALLERGLEPAVWRDTKSIRFGQNWKEQMFQAIEQTALFLAILSPNYRNSDYCNDESDYFQELREKGQDMRIGQEGLYRYLKVVRMPSDDGWHSGLLSDLQQIEFFTRDVQDTDFPVAFTSPEFTMKIRQAAHALAAALKAMRRTREMVYVASPADDVDVEWRSLRSELRAQGYVVGPAAKLNRGLSAEFLSKEFRGAVLSIHLLGSEYHPLAEKQIDLCAEQGQKMAIWIKKGADEQASPEQRRLLQGVREFAKIPKGTPLIEGSMGRTPVTDLLEMLKPKPAASPAGGCGTAGSTVYLICDPTVDEDRGFAMDLEKRIESTEKMQVVLPQVGSPGAAKRHEAMLTECDGVLLYSDKAPVDWFFQYFTDVNWAEKKLKRAPMKSKAVLAGADYLKDLQALPNVQLLGRTEPFSMASIEPFLAPLRVSATGVANAG